jgi:hypothetical protein
MKLKKKISLLALIGFLLQNCSFSPSDELYVVIPVPSTSQSSINLTSFGGGTINLISEKTFILDVLPQGKRVYFADVYLNGAKIYSLSSSSGTFSFSLDPIKIGDGAWELKIVVKHSSGNGSLSDKLDNEFVVLEKKFNLLIDLVPPTKISKPQIQIVDGNLKVSWQKPTKYNFIHYILVRNYLDNQGHAVVSDSTLISDLTNESYIDESYVGGKISYQVNLKGSNFYIKGDIELFDCIPIVVEYDQSFQVPEIKYSKPLLYNSRGIEIVINSLVSNIEYRSISTSGTYKTDKVLFGSQILYEVSISKKGNPSGHRYTTLINAHKGNKIPAYDFITYSKKENSYLLNRKNKIIGEKSILYKIDAISMEVTDSLLFEGASNSFPLFGQESNFIYLVLNDSKTIIQIDIASLDIVKIINGLTIFPGGNIFIRSDNAIVTDNNLLGWESDGTIYIIDLINEALILKTKSLNFSLSEDGEFLFINGILYSGGKDQLWSNLIGKLGYEDKLLYFRKPFGQSAFALEFYKAYDFDLTIPPNYLGFLSAPTVYQLNSTPTYYEDHVNMISGTNYIDQNRRELILYNATSFQEIRRVEFAKESQGARAVNNKLFHSNGFYMD